MESEIKTAAIQLLKELISTPSFSREEDQTAELIENWFSKFNIKYQREKNNIWAKNLHFDNKKPTILINSHHDTVKPNKGYTKDPFKAIEEEGKLFGLGSNDAGASLVCLMALFVSFYKSKNLKYNLLIATTAEEEISGKDGIRSLLKKFPPIDFALVGEPTEMHLAIAEKGLIVIDAYSEGLSGHAAHDNTENAIYNALDDIHWLRNYSFPRVSDNLGKVKINVTQINAGNQHNVVPSTCHFVIDIRVNDAYNNEEVFKHIDKHTKSKLIPRSLWLNSSSIPVHHPFVKAGKNIGRKAFGSSTISDQVHFPFPSLKMGPGKSERSHTADEYIKLSEIEDGFEIYLDTIKQIL